MRNAEKLKWEGVDSFLRGLSRALDIVVPGRAAEEDIALVLRRDFETVGEDLWRVWDCERQQGHPE